MSDWPLEFNGFPKYLLFQSYQNICHLHRCYCSSCTKKENSIKITKTIEHVNYNNRSNAIIDIDNSEMVYYTKKQTTQLHTLDKKATEGWLLLS